MSVQITIEVPESAFSALRASPDEFAREMRLAAAVKWYEMEMIAQSRAADLAGVTRQEFLSALNRYAVSPFQTTEQELAEELASFT